MRPRRFWNRSGRRQCGNHLGSRRALVRRRRLWIEALEDRRLLATVQWDGGPLGDGTDWNDPANWAGDELPGPRR